MRNLVFALLLLLPLGARAEVSELRVTRQPSIIYLAPIIMEQMKLVEANAARLGLPNLITRWTVFGSGGQATDTMLAGNVDIVTTGASNMLLLWDRTRGGVRGLGSAAEIPMWAVSRNPAAKSLRDLGPNDRIGVPTVKVSTQAILLQIAARKLFGDADYAHFDGLEVTMSHPDAAAALISGGGGITVHFSASPYQEQEARTPGLHVIATSDEILGQPFSNPVYFTTAKFRDANPTVIRAFVAAAREAAAFIAAHPREAAETYLRATGEKYPVDELVAIIGDGRKTFDTTPVGMQLVADHMADTKVLRSRPKSWKDFFWPEAHDQNGN
ncbi:MAG: ABC transporter substrate-binding protein [Acetobacteraceae bacterium]|nr:ABC transporter substrate-binding protein [Acetobacteraceae bacterium]